ncbi:MAG: hypothetical protein KZQ58_05615, partial [gamma proteobacterium symbiont of Bathyaustriella thionipta]|nr:hypothetical protein [gamma proteobacterium symbiont of Bathyaustriella thionipta]
MDFNFLTEAPSKEDRFNSKSHQLVADSIVNVFLITPMAQPCSTTAEALEVYVVQHKQALGS